MEIIFAQSTIFFRLIYILRIIFTLSCRDWFLMWVGLELNIISFIALVYDRNSRGVEVRIKYFFIQRLGSGILILIFFTEFFWFDYIRLRVLSYKMGGGPFYFWFPSICERLGWGSCLLLITIQKILPLLLITFLVRIFLWFIIITRILLGAIGSINQKRVKRLLGFSSVHHIGWIIIGNFIGGGVCIIYLIIYRLMILGVLIRLWKGKILELGRLKIRRSKWSFSLGILSLGGMPPMLGFYLKWWFFFNLIIIDFSLLFFIVVMSVLIFYVYLRIVYRIIIGRARNKSWRIINEKKIRWDIVYLVGVNTGVIMWILI